MKKLQQQCKETDLLEHEHGTRELLANNNGGDIWGVEVKIQQWIKTLSQNIVKNTH